MSGATPIIQTMTVVIGWLMPQPKTLHDLWTEWKVGKSGQRAASTFSLY
jgi:hypothetical protein